MNNSITMDTNINPYKQRRDFKINKQVVIFLTQKELSL